MFSKRTTILSVIFIVSSIFLWCQSPEAVKATDDGLILDYKVTLKAYNSPVEIELTIKNIQQTTLDLFVISFRSAQGGGEGNFPLVSEVKAIGTSGEELQVQENRETQPLSEYDTVDEYIPIDRWQINTQGGSEVTITYQLPPFREYIPHLYGSGEVFEDAYYGVYEFILLRPSRASALIEEATISHNLPENWSVATAYEEISSEVYDASALTNMYGDNEQVYRNYAETLFFWADTNKVSLDYLPLDEIEFIFIHTNNALPQKIQDGYVQLYRYFSTVLGPLPIERRIEINFREGSMFPAAHFNDHPLYGEWYSMDPGDLAYQNWKWEPHTVGEYGYEFVALWAPTMYTGVHRFARAWIGGMIAKKPRTDVSYFIYDGLINYYENHAMDNFWKPGLVHQRYADMYTYYKENWLGTENDLPVTQHVPGGHHFGEYKATLILYLLNQKIIENSSGEHSLEDATRLFYDRFAAIDEVKYPVLEDYLQAVNDATGENYDEFFEKYIYGIEALPLDKYFDDQDQDGLMTGTENEIGTDPENADTDGDGYDDGEEANTGTDPNIPATPTLVPSPTSTVTRTSTSTITATLAPSVTASPTSQISPTPVPSTTSNITPTVGIILALVIVVIVGLVWIILYRRKKS